MFRINLVKWFNKSLADVETVLFIILGLCFGRYAMQFGWRSREPIWRSRHIFPLWLAFILRTYKTHAADCHNEFATTCFYSSIWKHLVLKGDLQTSIFFTHSDYQFYSTRLFWLIYCFRYRGKDYHYLWYFASFYKSYMLCQLLPSMNGI